jgi:cysteinyl-tRNA synthetase
LREGARVEANSEKRNPTDFALWKLFQGDGKHEQEWESPWGTGYPGWHLECSAMAMKYLGETFDVHTGGIDHIPVHHNNEIAQSEAATSKPFAHYWLHGAFINIEGGKMAKSYENFLRLQLLIDKGINPLAYRLWLLGAHYSSPMNYSELAMAGTQNAYEKLISKFTELGTETGEVIQPFTESFLHFINDNLDMPKALALFYLVLNDDQYSKADRRATLLNFDRVLGLSLASIMPIEIPQKIQNLVDKREQARGVNDFTRADELRHEIQELGWRIEDSSEGPKLSKMSGPLFFSNEK